MLKTPQILKDLLNNFEDSFVISDTHFDHDKIFRFEPIRADWLKENDLEVNIENHNELLIKAWNMTVKPDDIVIHLGDFSWKSPQKFVNRLNGRKILILGNHDRKGEQVYKDFEYVVRGYQDLSKGFLQVTESDDRLFSCLQVDNIIFSHYPIKTEEIEGNRRKESLIKINERIDALKVIRGKISCLTVLNIHGHLHSKCAENKWFLHYKNVSCENIGFKPIKVGDILKEN